MMFFYFYNLQALGLEEMNEMQMCDVDGGIFGIDDAIFWGCVGMAVITYTAYRCMQVNQ